MSDTKALALAIKFHETYERLAPEFGYETRPDTKVFDPESKNGRLMVAVCAALSAAEGAPGQYFSEPPAKPEVREPAGYFRNAAATGEKPHYVQVDGHYTGAADIYPLYHARPQALEEVLPVSKDEQRLLFSEWYRQHTGDDPTLKNVRWFAFTKTAAVAFAAWLAAPTQAKAAEPSEQGGTK